MSIDKELMRETVRRCGTEYTTEEVVGEFEEKYIGYASTTEEAAGLAILLSQMQHWKDASMFFYARGLDEESVREFLQQESFSIARDISEDPIKPEYEYRGFKGLLRYILTGREFPLKKETRHDCLKKACKLQERLEKLYWEVVDSMKQREISGD